MSKRHDYYKPSTMEVMSRIPHWGKFAEETKKMLDEHFPNSPVVKVLASFVKNKKNSDPHLTVRLVYDPKKGQVNKHIKAFIQDVISLLDGTVYNGQIYVRETGKRVHEETPIRPTVNIKVMTIGEYEDFCLETKWNNC